MCEKFEVTQQQLNLELSEEVYISVTVVSR